MLKSVAVYIQITDDIEQQKYNSVTKLSIEQSVIHR